MAIIISILRWIGAVVLAFLVYVLALVVCAFVWKNFGTDPVRTMEFALAFAAAIAVFCGALVVARGQRRIAALALWAFAMATPLWTLTQAALSGPFNPVALIEPLWTLSGGLLGYYLVKLSAQTQDGRGVPGHPSRA